MRIFRNPNAKFKFIILDSNADSLDEIFSATFPQLQNFYVAPPPVLNGFFLSMTLLAQPSV